ncbi:MAG: DUF4012 domain-containing protein [Candidatus Promineifilaceae bacterium]
MSNTAVEQPVDEPTVGPLSGRLPRLLAVAGVGLILLALGIKLFAIARISQSLLSHRDEITTLFENGLAHADPTATENLVLDIRKDIVSLKKEAGPFVAIAPLFGWVPKIGPVLLNAPQLMEIADAGSEAGAYAIQGLSPAMTIMQTENTNGQSRIPQLMAVVDSAEPDLTQAAAAIDRLAAARADMTRVEQFPEPLAGLIQKLDAELPMAQDMLQLSVVLPEIMGSQGRKTYLIIAQNEDELRPTGGFISAAGLLIVENGQILAVNFTDAYNIDAYYKPGKPYDYPPQPFNDIMGMDLFLFRDSNFWPDFPVSAEKVMALFTYGQDIPVDGAIAIDQQFVRYLLQGVGTVYVNELAKNINAENVINEMRAEWGPDNDESNAWVSERKAFMGPLASAIQSTLENNLSAIDPINLLRQIQTAADQRHLQIYMRDPQVEAVLDKTGWDGSQANRAGQDYLLVVDTSMGFNKVSAAVELATNYNVVLVDDSTGQATVTLNYRYIYPLTSAPQPCTPGTVYFQGIQYQDLVDDCYWDYVRVYTPPSSQLLQSTSHPLSADYLLSGKAWDGETQVITDEPTPFTVFANFLLIPEGQTASTNFTYLLPDGVVKQEGGKNHYVLEVHKQAGIRSEPLTVTVTLPPQARFEQAFPAPTSVEGQTITFMVNLQQDQTFEVIYD